MPWSLGLPGETSLEPGTSGTSNFDACSGPPKWLTGVEYLNKINDCYNVRELKKLNERCVCVLCLTPCHLVVNVKC